MLLPCEDNGLRNMCLDRPSHRVGKYDALPRDIENGMKEVIENELDLMRHQDGLRHECEVRYDYNLGAFLRSQGHFATEKELLSIIRRIDTDGDARLSFPEFSDFMRPVGGPVVERPDVRNAPRQ